LENAHHAALNRAFQDVRLSSIDFQKFDCPESVIIDIVLNGKGIQLQALARQLSFEACLGSPSLSALISSEVIKENQAILVIMRMIDRLSKFFEKETMSSIEEVAWTIYGNYGYLSVEDFVKFFDFCKDKRYATDFQHIASKGINPEFLLSWLEAYAVEREKAKFELVKVVRDEGQSAYQLDENDLVKLSEIPIIRAQRTLDKSLVDRLKAEKKELELSQAPEEKLIDFFANNLLWFEADHCLKTNNERRAIATQRANELIKEWLAAFQKWFEQTEQGIGDIESTAFLTSKIKAFIYEKSRELSSKNAYSIVYSNLKKLAASNNFRDAEDLMLFFGITDNCTGTFPDIEYAIIHIAQKVNQQFSTGYYDYRKKMLDKEQLPTIKDDYQRKVAWLWVVQQCLNRISPKRL
jgi:hypothetical protein